MVDINVGSLDGFVEPPPTPRSTDDQDVALPFISPGWFLKACHTPWQHFRDRCEGPTLVVVRDASSEENWVVS
jgi:hypothetical protein